MTKFFLWTLVVAILAACNEQRRESSLTGPPVNAEANVGDVPPDAGADPAALHEALRVSLYVEGEFRPGEPVRATATVSSNGVFREVTLRLLSPEIELARATAWGDQYHIKFDWPIPPARQISGELNAGANISGTAEFVPEAPGIYRITAEASGDPVEKEFRAITASRKTLWILVQDPGGRIIPRVHGDFIPPGHLVEPGPFRMVPEGAIPPSSDVTASLLGQHEVTVYYYKFDPITSTSSFVRMPYHNVAVEYWLPGEQYPDRETFTADANGRIYYECGDDWANITYSASIKYSAAHRIRFDEYEQDYSQAQNYQSCFSLPQGGPEFEMPDTAAQLFTNLREAKTAASASVGESAWSYVNFHSGVSQYYNGEVYISYGQFWGDEARWVHHHEYGHVLHDVLWGGHGLGSCLSEHGLGVSSNPRCAYSEGIASWFTTISGAPHANASFESGTFALGGGGYEIEGAVAAFLNDLTDGISSSDHDAIDLTPIQVSDAIEGCEVTLSSSWVSADRVHYLIHCLEGQVYGYPTYFPSSDEPSGAWAYCPGLCSTYRMAIRESWLWNLFGES